MHDLRNDMYMSECMRMLAWGSVCVRPHDMAMLAVIHRAVLRQGPQHFHPLFVRAAAPIRLAGRMHDRQLDADMYERMHRDYISRSIFGYIWIYNLLPQFVVNAPSAKIFQKKCQSLLRVVAASGGDEWKALFCPRQPRNHHLLRRVPCNFECK